MSVRVRFAPSPTGHVHIGNIRAAIFNWLFARHEGGRFLLRIEDTDRERSTPEAIETLLDAMRWLGLNWDEEILYQTSRLDAHRQAAEELERRGDAYRFTRKPGEAPPLLFRMPVGSAAPPCVRVAGPATIDLHPESPVTVDRGGICFAQVSGRGKPAPGECGLGGMAGLRLRDAAGQCLFALDEHLAEIVSGARDFRIERAARAEFLRREVVFRDLVKGELAKPLDGMKDQVLLRSNGAPVFHLANVCDDIAQRVTHIVRGDDHVENTYRHVLLFHALGAQPPLYAHLPMIVNQQGKPYSKRDGDAYVGEFREKGFLPEALFNYLTLLGWSPGDDREKLSRDELVRLFTLDRVRGAPSQMDLRKLLDMNRQYVAEQPPEQFAANVRRALAHCDWAQGVDESYFRRVCALMQSRTHVYRLAEGWRYFFVEDPGWDEEAGRKHLGAAGMAGALAGLRDRLAACDFSVPAIEAAIHEAEAAAGIAAGRMNQPIRVAVTGTTQGAGIFETIELLGRDRALARLDRAVRRLSEAAR